MLGSNGYTKWVVRGFLQEDGSCNVPPSQYVPVSHIRRMFSKYQQSWNDMSNLIELAILLLQLSDEEFEVLTVTNGKAGDVCSDDKFLAAEVQDC